MQNLASLPLEELYELAQQYDVIDECVFSDADVTVHLGRTRLTMPHDEARTFAHGLVQGHLRTLATLPLRLRPSRN